VVVPYTLAELVGEKEPYHQRYQSNPHGHFFCYEPQQSPLKLTDPTPKTKPQKIIVIKKRKREGI
jgi:hypothetical protein